MVGEMFATMKPTQSFIKSSIICFFSFVLGVKNFAFAIQSFQGRDADVHYAALSLTRSSRRHLQEETESVYTRVRTAK